MTKIVRYLPEEKDELKLNILKALEKDSFLTKEQLKTQFGVGKNMVEIILGECLQEELIRRLGGYRKILTRRGLEYLNRNY